MKIGILTMHRVVNYGSALQAYALQRKLELMGYEAEIIDYVFPTPQKIALLARVMKVLRRRLYMMRIGKCFSTTKESKFRHFRESFLKLSKQVYDKRLLMENPPLYDVYMVGSDQVWNPRWMKDDLVFFLPFVNDEGWKVSYASSFAVSQIDERFKVKYASALGRFRYISVREKSGLNIVRQLTGKKAEHVCDPTMLLDEEDYEPLVQLAKVRVEGPYILAYILGYMFNPFPEVNRIISGVSKDLCLPVVYLDGNKYVVFDKTCQTVNELSPCDFLWLFKHASFIITSSYHGSIFASIYSKPLLAVTRKGDNDDRIISLLSMLDCSKSQVDFDDKTFSLSKNYNIYIPSKERVQSFRAFSSEVLSKMLKKNI